MSRYSHQLSTGGHILLRPKSSAVRHDDSRNAGSNQSYSEYEYEDLAVRPRDLGTERQSSANPGPRMRNCGQNLVDSSSSQSDLRPARSRPGIQPPTPVFESPSSYDRSWTRSAGRQGHRTAASEPGQYIDDKNFVSPQPPSNAQWPREDTRSTAPILDFERPSPPFYRSWESNIAPGGQDHAVYGSGQYDNGDNWVNQGHSQLDLHLPSSSAGTRYSAQFVDFEHPLSSDHLWTNKAGRERQNSTISGSHQYDHGDNSDDQGPSQWNPQSPSSRAAIRTAAPFLDFGHPSSFDRPWTRDVGLERWDNGVLGSRMGDRQQNSVNPKFSPPDLRSSSLGAGIGYSPTFSNSGHPPSASFYYPTSFDQDLDCPSSSSFIPPTSFDEGLNRASSSSFYPPTSFDRGCEDVNINRIQDRGRRVYSDVESTFGALNSKNVNRFQDHSRNVYSGVESAFAIPNSKTIAHQHEFDFTRNHKVTFHSPVFRTPSPPDHSRFSSSCPDKMHITTPSISWELGGVGAPELYCFDQIEDEDQFSYSNNEVGDKDQQQQVKVEYDDDDVEYGDGSSDGREKVWLSGSGRDEWCKMKADVEEELRKTRRLAELDYLKRSMRSDGGGNAGAFGASVSESHFLRENSSRPLNEEEVVGLREEDNDSIASLFGEDGSMEPDTEDFESTRTLIQYEELLVSTIQNLAKAEDEQKTQLELERSRLLAIIRSIRANTQAGKEDVENSSELVDSSDRKRKDTTATTPLKRKRDGEAQGDQALDASAIDKGLPKPKRQRRTAEQIAADKEQKIKDNKAKEAAREAAKAAKKAEQETRAAARKAEQEAKRAAREAEKQRLKDEKAAEKANNRTPGRIARDARKEALERDKIAKAMGLPGKPKGASNWKTKAPGEASRWKTREEQAALERLQADADAADAEWAE